MSHSPQTPRLLLGLVLINDGGFGGDGSSPPAIFLTLGYEDDGYGDNGYWSHDDGTGDQCKNSIDAYLVLSIGHNGALAPDPASFIGITPALFRCQGGWAFHNFNTGDLSWSSFTNAFTLDFWDYADPLTYVTFGAGRGLASGGNCEGMSLLALVGEDQFVVNDIKESFWANYKGAGGPNGLPASNVVFDINVAHGNSFPPIFCVTGSAAYSTAPAPRPPPSNVTWRAPATASITACCRSPMARAAMCWCRAAWCIRATRY